MNTLWGCLKTLYVVQVQGGSARRTAVYWRYLRLQARRQHSRCAAERVFKQPHYLDKIRI